MTDAPHVRVREPGNAASIALAILVHVALAALLIYGVRWKTEIADVIEVDLVRPIPSPEPVAKTEPEPKVEPKPTPKPPPPPPKPDIALKEKEKPKPKPVPPKPVPWSKSDPFKQQLLDEEKRLATQKQLADDERKVRQQREAQAATARARGLAAYTDRIRAKIRGNIMLPQDLKGNPSAIFEVAQLPTGEVISTRLVKSSGHIGYDTAVERAILKSSPLPRPDDPGLFERNLRLIFCPTEDGKCS
jgi:colicin import membrane protein